MEKKGQRLSKVLASAGVASRRACETIIANGRVKVNGKAALLPQTMVSLKSDKILLDGKPITSGEKKVTYLLNKPVGYVCSNARKLYDNIVLDLFRESSVRLFTVGRLDKDTQGLLIVTNDGHLANSIIHPSSDIEKEYRAIVNSDVSLDNITLMRQGAYVHGTFVKPKSVTKTGKNSFDIVVKEGKKHEVRLLAKRADLKIVELTRIRIGKIKLGRLKPGEWRKMTDKEKQLLN